jgi:hypothetical protein
MLDAPGLRKSPKADVPQPRVTPAPHFELRYWVVPVVGLKQL